ncbi:FAR1-related sequence 5-like protein [Tanacetum coccineum]
MICHLSALELIKVGITFWRYERSNAGYMDPSHSSALSSVSQNSHVVSLNDLTEEIVAYEKESDDTHAVKNLDALCTPESFVTHSNFDTLRGNCLYNIPKYAAEAGFVVRRSCQKRMLNGDVRQKKFVLNAFDTIHNHELEREELKHLSKRERQLDLYGSSHYCRKLAIGEYRCTKSPAPSKLGINGILLLVQGGTTVAFKNFFLERELQIGDSDAQMRLFIRWKIEKSMEFRAMLYRRMLLKTNKYKMVFVPCTAIDNHRKCVTVAAGLLKNETTKSYIWSESENSFFSHFTNSGSTLMNFMNCFETAMEKQRHVQERMDHKTIDTVPKLKTLLKIELNAQGSDICIIKESPYVYEMPNKKKKKPQSVDKGNDKADENDKVDMFFKKDGLYKFFAGCVGDVEVTKRKRLKLIAQNPPSKNKTNNLEQLVESKAGCC